MLRTAVIGLLALGACAPPPPHATPTDAIRVNVELAQLEHGRSLLLQKCGGCHTPPHPSEHTAAEWPVRLDEMAARSNLDPDQRRAIEQYLVAVLSRQSRR